MIGDGAIEVHPSVSVISGSAPTNPIAESEMDALLLGRTRELVASSPGQRNWRGIFIALLVIAAVLGLIVFSIFLLSPEDEGARVRGRRLTLSDVNNYKLRWKPFNGTWINDVELVYRDPSGGLSILNIETTTIRVLMTNSTFRQLNAEKFLVSPDLKFVLLLSDRNDHGARYYVYEVQTRNKFPLSPKDGARDPPKLQHVIWGPVQLVTQLNGLSTKTNSQPIAFVYENDLYYKPKVQSDLVCRLTSTGKRGVIYNGIPNWLYSNTPELVGETVAFSTDGSYISFITFNDTDVQQYQYTWLGDNLKYPQVKSIRYPKTHTTNPNATVYVVDLSVLKFINKIQIHSPPQMGNNSYVGNMIWISASELSVTFTNREQTSALTVLCRAPIFFCKEIYMESVIDNGWVLPADKIIFSKQHLLLVTATSIPPIPTASNQSNASLPISSDFDQNEFETGIYMLKRLPVRDGEHGYYRHVVFVSTADMRTVPLTMGRFEVTEILGWDETNEIVYFMATPELKSGQRQMYKISLKLNVTDKPNRIFINSSAPTCLTCDNSPDTFKLVKNISNSYNYTVADSLDSREQPERYESLENIPNNCLFNRIIFSKGFSHYVQECLGPDTPSTYLVETATASKIHVLHNGDALRNRIASIALPQIRTFSVEIRHGFHAQVRLFLPPGMKEEEEIAFPLILHVDASPGSQLVSEKFNVDWNWYLCSQKSMIVAQIDARGSGFQGELLRQQIKGKLGSVEIEDQLGVLTYLRDTLKFIDPTRICTYGWGYGGYAASMTLAEDSQRVLQCALAINPIVSFSFQTSFFTERYLPYNEDFLRALQESDLSIRAGNIDSRNYLLIHGTADTTVHQQNSLTLARALIDQEVGFRHQVYTDEDHRLQGAHNHLYKTIEWFFDESFGPLETTDWDPTGFFAFKQ